MNNEQLIKEKELAIQQIVELLNKYNLTIAIEHIVKIVPKQGE